MPSLMRRDPIGEMLFWNRAMERMLNNMDDDGELGFGEPLNLRKKEEVKPRRIAIKGESGSRNVIEGKSKNK